MGSYNYILPELAQGSEPPDDAVLPFDTVFLCAEEAQPKLDQRGLEIIRLQLDDSGQAMQAWEVRQAVEAGRMTSRRLEKGKRVLVTCFAGRNRSGLVSALALVNLGFSDNRAITMVREARGPFALSNRQFCKVIRLYAFQMHSRRAS